MHERLHESIKRFIEDGTIRLIETPIDITRFEYDEVIYKHMSEEQSLDFEKLLEIYTTQRQWRDFKSNEEVIKFLNLSQDENKKNINDLKIITKEKSKIKLKEPKKYSVIMENDDFTTMEFVIDVLMSVFNKDSIEANRIMLDVHSKGRGVVGTYPYDIAVTKVSIAMDMAKEEGFPFMITIEEV